MQTITQSAYEYNRSARQWEAKLPDNVVVFPAGREGKRAAMLSVLTQDAPHIAAEVDALIQNRAELTDRALKAGFIVHEGGVELLHWHHYRVQSQSDPTTRYIVAYFEGSKNWSCQCADWQNGNAHYYGMERKTYAPHVPGIGPTCKHVLACIIGQAVDPAEPCPACNGMSIEGFDSLPKDRWPASIQVCPECNGVGAVKSLDDDEYTYPYDPEFDDPMTYDDKPLSDQEYFDLQELRRELIEEAYY